VISPLKLSHRHSTPQVIAISTAGFAILTAVLTLLGWFTNTPALADWFGTGIMMVPNTALAALGAGISILLLTYGRIRAGRIAGGATALLGAATLAEHVFGINFGIDTLLVFQEWGNRAAASRGRMGPVSCC
jgi:hypothetical protein